VNQATSVTVRRVLHLVEPTRANALAKTQHNATLVRALFGQFCAALSHPSSAKGLVRCPADFGISYLGTFYDGHRTLAKFVYGVTGCQVVSLTTGGKTKSTMVLGAAATAAPKLRADMAAVLGVPSLAIAQPVTGLVEVELAVLDPEDERVPLGLGEIEPVAVGVGRVVHHVKPGLIGLVRGD
jgi:hypothetical protein